VIISPVLQTLIQGGIFVKKFLAITLSLIFALSLSACGIGSGDMDSSSNQENRDNRDNIMSDSGISSQMSDILDSTATANIISRDRAIEIALNQAGLKQTDIRDLDTELDRDYNGSFWEVDFEAGEYEYSYDINAETEAITDFHREPID
jgi:uncharacterized membrane protein YkoI